MLAMSDGPNQLQGVENVFEHNIDHFENLMEQSANHMKPKQKKLLAAAGLPIKQMANFLPMQSTVMPM